MEQNDIRKIALKERNKDIEAPLDLQAYDISGRDAYLAFVATWKLCWHDEVAKCREAKCAMREKGGGSDATDRRGEACFRREGQREILRYLHRLRLRAKAGSKIAARCAREAREAA